MTKTAAIMGGNIVENIIVVDDIEQSSKDLNRRLIEYTVENPAGIGWTYDEETGQFNPPVEVIPVEEPTE
jgi:hypothetical protein